MSEAPAIALELYKTSPAPVIAASFADPEDILEQADLHGVANILRMPASSAAVADTVRQTIEGLVPMRAMVQQVRTATSAVA